MVRSSFLSPTNIDIPTPTAFNFRASFIEVVRFSFDKSPSTLGPPETLRKIGVFVIGVMQFLNIPLVRNRESQKGIRGSIVSFGFFSPVVGPWKYP